MGNNQSIPYEPSPYSIATSSAAKPSKSAMRRSRSVRNEANGLQHNLPSEDSTATAKRFMPNMNRAGNGLIMPTGPYGASKNKALAHGEPALSSEMSPQWGWYINTTPPTPEMYHSGSNRLQRHVDVQGAPLAPHSTQLGASSAIADGRRCQNPVFQTLQSSNAPMGWTSVPI